MFFSGGLIPTYLTVKSLGLIDSRWAMILPGAMAGFQVLVARTFFQTAIPEELVEASRVRWCFSNSDLCKNCVATFNADHCGANCNLRCRQLELVFRRNDLSQFYVFISTANRFKKYSNNEQAIASIRPCQNDATTSNICLTEIRLDSSFKCANSAVLSINPEIFCEGIDGWLNKGIIRGNLASAGVKNIM